MIVKYNRILFFSLVIVGMFCVLGIYARPMPFDEYGFYNNVASEGFIQSQISYYTGWTGRILNTFLVCLFASFRLETIQPYLPFITVITYILAAFSLIGALFPSLTSRAKISLSLLACTLTLCFTYSLRQTFYWLPGMPYFWSGTLIILALSLAIRAYRGSHLSFILCMIVLFLNATNLEQPCIFQGIIAFLAMLMFMVRGNRKGALMSGAFWLVSIAGFCVMYFAPGTAVRMSSMTTAERSVMRDIMLGLRPALSLGILEIFQFLAKPLIYIVLFFMPAIAAKIPPFDEKLSQREKGITNLRVPPLKAKPALIFSEINPNADWSWPFFAKYYGANEIHLVPEELTGNPDDVVKLMSANLEPYAKLAEKGDNEAMMIIGHYLNPRLTGGNPESKNADEALRWYTLGAEAGNSQCMKYRARLLMTRNFLQAVYCQIRYHLMITRL